MSLASCRYWHKKIADEILILIPLIIFCIIYDGPGAAESPA